MVHTLVYTTQGGYTLWYTLVYTTQGGYPP